MRDEGFQAAGQHRQLALRMQGPGGNERPGSITYGGNSYSGTTRMSMKRQGRVMNRILTYIGKRVGNCK